ncbi:hypothetical protein D4R52_00770 [bacterium]|nr:MAG: hypothetical protein D4R52_00770 [bacterium]
MNYIWFFWSLILLGVWVVIFIFLKSKSERKVMLSVSFWTSLLGLTEPLFVPTYWNPPSLFNLAKNTGFDLESLIFSFAIGGIAFVLYELIFKTRHQAMTEEERHLKKHRFHKIALLPAPALLIVLLVFTKLNPIYSAAIAMVVGGLATWYCRPDLKQKMIASAFLFLALYFVYFLILNNLLDPNYMRQVWNLKAISGILWLGVPLEELMFAFTFGFIWSSAYEHFTWKRINN